MATCPDCEFDEIETEDFDEGDTLTCPECGKTLVYLGDDEVELEEAAAGGDEDDDVEDDEADEEKEDDDEDDDPDEGDEAEDVDE